jgi:hypothetical protein
VNQLFAKMTGVWIVVSTRWGFANVQAALNVVISVIGASGIWAFSRFWWQRGTKKALVKSDTVPLSSLFTLTGPGEGWDLMKLLRNQLFAKENWHLLIQLIVVLTVTLATILAGPIARVSLRSGQIVRSKELNVLHTTKGAGRSLNLVTANILWNDTIQSMDSAGFPNDQLMEFVPSPTDPWVYRQDEWDPTWHADCNYTDETVVHDLAATGNETFSYPLRAFPAYRRTMEPFWLNESIYRFESSWATWTNYSETPQVKEFIAFILLQTDPLLEDQMNHNQNPLRLSITQLHLREIGLHANTETLTGADYNTPVGTAEYASYTRVECLFTRKQHVEDETMVPWLWTNDTFSVVAAYADFHYFSFMDAARHQLEVKMVSSRELFRFYQAYLASITTNASRPSLKSLSTRIRTVELSAITLAIILFIFILIIWSTVRYIAFGSRHKSEIQEIYVPDAKLEWMMHAVKSSQTFSDEEIGRTDREQFQSAVFGSKSLNQPASKPRPARVYSSRSSFAKVTSATPIAILQPNIESDTNSSHQRLSVSTSPMVSAPSLIPMSAITPTEIAINDDQSSRPPAVDESVQEMGSIQPTTIQSNASTDPAEKGVSTVLPTTQNCTSLNESNGLNEKLPISDIQNKSTNSSQLPVVGFCNPSNQGADSL